MAENVSGTLHLDSASGVPIIFFCYTPVTKSTLICELLDHLHMEIRLKVTTHDMQTSKYNHLLVHAVWPFIAVCSEFEG